MSGTRFRTALAVAMTFVLAPYAQAGWVVQDVPDFGFSALFPKAPEREATDDDGLKITTFGAAVPGAMCIVVVGDYPYVINPDQETVASRDNFAKGVEAQVTSSNRTTFPRAGAQLQAMEFEAVSATYTFRSLIVIEGSRAYQIAGGVPKPDGDTAELEACVRGFRLLANP